MNKFKSLFFFTAAIIIMAACEKDINGQVVPPPSSENDKDRVENINGTAIDKKSNIAGLILNSETGIGISGVPVTDGYTYTVTDNNGVYQMKANRYCRNVYYSLPSEYKTTLDKSTHLPLFYSTKKISYKEFNRVDFELQPKSENEDNFTYVGIGDPQCKNASDAGRYVNETVADIVNFLNEKQSQGKYMNVYGMTLGDIIHDTPDLWNTMKKTMSNVSLKDGRYIPFYQTIGNHDFDPRESTQYNATKEYCNTFGPTDYSFNVGKVHIVTMNDVVCKTTNGKTWSIDSGFSSAQVRWLREDLSYVKNKEDKMIILNVHVPFRNGTAKGGSLVNTDKYYDEVLSLLTDFKEAHIMAGHRHFSQNWVHKNRKCKGGKPIYEHILAAACGSFWCCDSNLDGSPNGYSVFEIEGNTMKNWKAKGSNHPEDFQMRIYDGNQIFSGTKHYSYSWYAGGNGGSANILAKGQDYLAGAFVAEIWNSDDMFWKVEFFQNGQKVADMKRVPEGVLSNACATSFYFNEKNKNAAIYAIAEASHYWYYKPVSERPSNERNWEVVAAQTIPSSNEVNVYRSSVFQTDYTGF